MSEWRRQYTNDFVNGPRPYYKYVENNVLHYLATMPEGRIVDEVNEYTGLRCEKCTPIGANGTTRRLAVLPQATIVNRCTGEVVTAAGVAWSRCDRCGDAYTVGGLTHDARVWEERLKQSKERQHDRHIEVEPEQFAQVRGAGDELGNEARDERGLGGGDTEASDRVDTFQDPPF